MPNEAVTMRALSGENATLGGQLELPCRTVISAQFAVSQTRTAPSHAAAAMRAPSGETEALPTRLSGPRSTAISAPVAVPEFRLSRSWAINPAPIPALPSNNITVAAIGQINHRRAEIHFTIHS